jgi:hypothetical protein
MINAVITRAASKRTLQNISRHHTNASSQLTNDDLNHDVVSDEHVASPTENTRDIAEFSHSCPPASKVPMVHQDHLIIPFTMDDLLHCSRKMHGNQS